MNVIVASTTFKLNGAPVRTAEDVAAEFLAAKRAEAKAKDERVELEKELIKLLGIRDEGSKTHPLDGFKVTIKATQSIKVDWDVFDRVSEGMPLNLLPYKMERKLDETGVKYLRNNEPDLYAKIAPALTVTPQKPQVVVALTE